MRKAVVMAMITTASIFSANYEVQAQVGVSIGPILLLIKGDTPNTSTPSCSFISNTELMPMPIVSRLSSVLLGDSPDQVRTEMGFTPAQSASRSMMLWTSTLGGQYIQAAVKFRNQRVITRQVTMATNFQQANEKKMFVGGQGSTRPIPTWCHIGH